MTFRDEIVSKIQGLPENSLPEVYDFVSRVASTEKRSGLLQRIQKIKIEGPTDFSRNIDLYLNGEKSIEQNIR